ncbi:adenylate cyclase [Pelomyxa schiedti]|nr:adenylate cyclase [Pelomyxa schiedti]
METKIAVDPDPNKEQTGSHCWVRFPLVVILVAWVAVLVTCMTACVGTLGQMDSRHSAYKLGDMSRTCIRDRVYSEVVGTFSKGLSAALFARDYMWGTADERDSLIWRDCLNSSGGLFEEARVLEVYLNDHPQIRLLGFTRYSSIWNQSTIQVECVTHGKPLMGISDNSTGFMYQQYSVNETTNTFYHDQMVYEFPWKASMIPSFDTWVDHEGELVGDPYQTQLQGVQKVLTLLNFAFITRISSTSLMMWRASMDLESISKFVQNLQLPDLTRLALVEANFQIVAASEDGITFNQTTNERVVLPRATDKLLSDAGKFLQATFHNMSGVPDNYSEKIDTSKGEANLDIAKWQLNENSTTFWVIMITPTSEFLYSAKKFLNVMLIVVIVVSLAGIFFAVLTSRWITKPLVETARRLHMISHLEFEETSVKTANSPFSEIHAIQASYYAMEAGLKSLSLYLPVSLVKSLLHSNTESKLGVKNANCTVLFMDVKGFSSLCQDLSSSQRALEAVGECFDCFTQIIASHHGTVDKFIGAETVFQCRKKLQELQTSWETRNLPRLNIKFGINTGPVLVGNVGGSKRFDYTVVGHTGVDVLISEEMYNNVCSTFLCRKVRSVTVKGISQKIAVYEPMCHKMDCTKEYLAMLESFDSIVNNLDNGLTDVVASQVQKHCKKFPDDMAAQALLATLG